MAKKNYTIQGIANWAKVLGDPVPNYSGDNREWTLDLTPNEEGVATLKELGLEDRIKNKDDDRGNFIQFRQREKRRDGSLNRRIAVVDREGQPWPQDKLIGNGSEVKVKFDYRDYGKGKIPGVYPQAIQVVEHKEYVPVHFAPLPPKQDEGRLPDAMEPVAEDDFPE